MIFDVSISPQRQFRIPRDSTVRGRTHRTSLVSWDKGDFSFSLSKSCGTRATGRSHPCSLPYPQKTNPSSPPRRDHDTTRFLEPFGGPMKTAGFEDNNRAPSRSMVLRNEQHGRSFLFRLARYTDGKSDPGAAVASWATVMRLGAGLSYNTCSGRQASCAV
jgi:hypothetical protein